MQTKGGEIAAICLAFGGSVRVIVRVRTFWAKKYGVRAVQHVYGPYHRTVVVRFLTTYIGK